MCSVKLPDDWLDKAVHDVMDETKDWPQALLNLQAIFVPEPEYKSKNELKLRRPKSA